MEEWQKQLINRKLPQLISNIYFSAHFLAHFQARDVLNESDVALLSAQQTSSEKVRYLLDILKTRVNAFHVLKYALSETSQSGALQNLTNADPSSLSSVGSFRFDARDLIGGGYYDTKVYYGSFGGAPVAIKCIQCDDRNYDVLRKELEKLIVLGYHENVVRVFSVQMSADNFRYIWSANELCQMNLNKWLGYGKSCVKISTKDIISQIISGMEHLHKKSIPHGNLNPNNILVHSECVGETDRALAKISDAGISKLKMEMGLVKYLTVVEFGMGTDVGWMAPEILCTVKDIGSEPRYGQLTLTKEADVFSLGCILYYVITEGEHPFGNAIKRNGNIHSNSPRLNVSDVIDQTKSCKWMALIASMIAHNTIDRPSISDVSNNSLFASKAVRRKRKQRESRDRSKVTKNSKDNSIKVVGIAQIGPSKRIIQQCRELTSTVRWDLNFHSKDLFLRDWFISTTGCKHENVLRQFRFKEEHSLLTVITEHYDMNLMGLLKEDCYDSFSLLQQVTNGIEYLHSINILHLNLSPLNILLEYKCNGNHIVKISNFQHAKMAGDIRKGAKLDPSFKGSEGWIPPEIYEFLLCDDSEAATFVTDAADMFNLGLLFYFILTGGEHPFGHFFERRSNIVDGHYKLKSSLFTNVREKNTLALISKLIDKATDNRPPVSYVQLCLTLLGSVF